MNHRCAGRAPGRARTDRLPADAARPDSAQRRRRTWPRRSGIALVLLAVAACGGGGGGGGGSNAAGGGAGEPATVASIALDRGSVFLEAGERAPVTATLRLSGGGTASRDSDVAWSVGRTSVAEIAGEDGTTATLKGVSNGRTTVTAESGGYEASAEVFVAQEVTLQVRPTALHLPPQCRAPIRARLVTDRGVARDVTQRVAWSVANGAAVAIADDGRGGVRVRAKRPATPVTSVVSASLRGRRGTGRVTVAELGSLSLVDASDDASVPAGGITLAQGEPRSLRAIGRFVQHPDFPDRDVTDCGAVEWRSDDRAVATVDDAGVITGEAPGTTRVTASYNGVASPGVTVTVDGDRTSGPISIVPAGPLDLAQGAVTNLTAEVGTDAGPAVDITPAVDWRSDSPSVATVSTEPGSRGRVTGIAPGQAVVSASRDGFHEGSVIVNVDSSPAAPGDLVLRADPNVVQAGDGGDASTLCAYLVRNDADGLVAETDIAFSIEEGQGAVLSRTTASTGDAGESACVDLVPESASEAGLLVVRAAESESESGLNETATVELVDEFGAVFDARGTVDPPLADDGTASAGTVFEATLVNGSNRAFTVDEDSLAFCGGGGPIGVATRDVGNKQVPGGGQIVVSVDTGQQRTSAGFAVALSLSDESTDTTFPVRHQFTAIDAVCDPG